jgi:hypothetical protein
VEDWKEETAADLRDAKSRLAPLLVSLSGDPTDEQLESIWRAYVDVEKSVVFVRVELDEENPGRFVNAKAYKVPDERQAVSFALNHLGEGARLFESGELARSLAELRESRNYLRVLLREKGLLRARRIKTSRSA